MPRLLKAPQTIGILLVALTICAHAGVSAQSMTPGHVVKVTTDEMENGTGNIVGADADYVYVVTAAHVVQDAGKVMEIMQDPNPVVIHTNSTLDVAVIRFKKPAGIMLEAFQVTIGRDQFSTYGMSSLHYWGFPGGSLQADEVKESFLAPDYYNDNAFFRMSVGSVETGHSGSFVYNSNGEVVGMLIETNQDQTASKVLKFQALLSYLKQNQVPVNACVPPLLINTWLLDSANFPNGSHEFKQKEELTFQNDGRFSGFMSGTFSIEKGEITIRASEWKFFDLTPHSQQGSFTSLASFFTADDAPYTLRAFHGFNFEPGAINDPSAITMILSNSSVSIFITRKK